MPTASSVLILNFAFVCVAMPDNDSVVMKLLAERKKNVGCSTRKVFAQRSRASFGARSVPLARQHQLSMCRGGQAGGDTPILLSTSTCFLLFDSRSTNALRNDSGSLASRTCTTTSAASSAALRFGTVVSMSSGTSSTSIAAGGACVAGTVRANTPAISASTSSLARVVAACVFSPFRRCFSSSACGHTPHHGLIDWHVDQASNNVVTYLSACLCYFRKDFVLERETVRDSGILFLFCFRSPPPARYERAEYSMRVIRRT